MFCPNCGANLPDNAAFCGNCGSSLNGSAPAQPNVSAREKVLAAEDATKMEAARTVKETQKIAYIICAVLAALILISVLITNNTSFLNLPITKMAIEEREREQLADTLEESAEILEESDDLLEEIEDEYDAKIFKRVQKMLKLTEKTAKNFSLANIIALLDIYTELADELDDRDADALGVSSGIDSMKEVAGVFKTVRTIIICIALFGILMAVLTAWRQLNGLAVLGIIVFVPVCALLSNVLLALVIMAGYIALMVYSSKVKKAMKAFA